MPEQPASTFEPTPQASRCWTAGVRRTGPSSSRSASGSGSRPRTGKEGPTVRVLAGLGDLDAADRLGRGAADGAAVLVVEQTTSERQAEGGTSTCSTEATPSTSIGRAGARAASWRVTGI